MKNELFHIGGITVYGYGLMIAIAVLSAYLSAEYRAKKMKLEYEKIFNLTVWCALGGILGAKLLYYITIIPDIIEDPSIILDFADGFVVYGGIIFGIFAGFLFCKKHKWNFLQYFDLVMPSIALAQGFGRIGCLLAGCCYGIPTDSCIGITFHSSEYAPNNISLVPTQIISSALDFLNFGVLILIARKNKVHGVIAGCYLAFYSAGRFVLEFFRGDLDRGSVGSLTTSQFISVFLFLFGIGIIVVQSVRYQKKHAIGEKAIEGELSEVEYDELDESEYDEMEESEYDELDESEEDGMEESEYDESDKSEYDELEKAEEDEMDESEEDEMDVSEIEASDLEEWEIEESDIETSDIETSENDTDEINEFETEDSETELTKTEESKEFKTEESKTEQSNNK